MEHGYKWKSYKGLSRHNDIWRGKHTKRPLSAFYRQTLRRNLQAYVFPYRNYDASTARWRSSDTAGYSGGPNQHFYAGTPTLGLDILGTLYYYYHDGNGIITIQMSIILLMDR